MNHTPAVPWTPARILNCLFLAALTAVIAVGADRIIHEAWKHGFPEPTPPA